MQQSQTCINKTTETITQNW